MNQFQARFNMVEQQIRPWDVLDVHLLDSLYEVRREDYVPQAYAHLAFADTEIPLAHGESMLSPKLEARLVQSLNLKKSDTVLHVGTGSGYVAALLGHLAGSVTSLEIHSDMADAARQKLAGHGLNNVKVVVGDGAHGWPGHWDAILYTASFPQVPQDLIDSLQPGARLVAVVGEAPVMTASLWVRQKSGEVTCTPLFETTAPALHHTDRPSHFTF
jgi:protein-L-isoaspartate(D-aspartate) O-methyltransferase